jgi:hypothetical protein
VKLADLHGSAEVTIESYVLDSIFTHKSARYDIEGVLNGFATDNAVAILPNRNIIMFSERNSEALNAADNSDSSRNEARLIGNAHP